ncbi:MAG: DUF433 domain-containing protein [Flavobacterium sp.]|nr:DUF433 domain-containing protein [Flavobacterium sp.]
METWNKLIAMNSEIRFGKPVISGTRITVADILSWRASGMSHEAILEDFFELTKESILAVFSFATNKN